MRPHIINQKKITVILLALHSGLIEKFDDEELQFVIGHEIGHLISKSADLMRIIDFLFPVAENMPLVFQHNNFFVVQAGGIDS